MFVGSSLVLTVNCYLCSVLYCILYLHALKTLNRPKTFLYQHLWLLALQALTNWHIRSWATAWGCGAWRQAVGGGGWEALTGRQGLMEARGKTLACL